MSIELAEFHTEFFQEVLGLADADGRFAEDSFFDLFCDNLEAAGELDESHRAQYLSRTGLRVDGYGGDPAENSGGLSLIIADFNHSQDVETLTATEMEAIFKRANKFLQKSLDSKFRSQLEETSAAYGLADLISARWKLITKVRLILVSKRLLSSRVDGREAGEFDGKPVTYSVWDLGRLYRFSVAGRGREELVVDLGDDFGGPVHVLPAHLDEAGYEAYLAVVPGTQLADVYERWGARLLEQNVRCFLQARSNVNKGIRNTIQNEPEMFFAYNNGITATAESIETVVGEHGMMLSSMKNFQIVNGGQTTASIHAASKKTDVDLSQVFVQMKLSIVPPDKATEIVPKISEYANSQNRVNAADFFANHPFHQKMERFSRRLYAPSPDGTFRESKWFYERARGQYQDARAYLTPAQRKKFDLEYPKKQMYSKTDLAKFLNLWHGHPDIVSRGAQKNFVHFADMIGKAWEKDPSSFNEDYYRHAIAKAIIFRHVEKLVTNQDWYEGGYRANVVAYTISKLNYDVGFKGRSVNFDRIWKGQAVSPALDRALTVAAKAVHDVIIEPDEGVRNVTEWAKKQACWSRVQQLQVNWPESLWEGRELISGREKKRKEKEAKKDQKILNGIEAQMAVVNAGAEFWRQVKDWGDEHKLLSEKESGILLVATQIPRKLPSEKQSLLIIQILSRLHEEGCPLGQDLG